MAGSRLAVGIRPWSDDDRPLLERLAAHMSGIEGSLHAFAIVLGPGHLPVGWIGCCSRSLGEVQVCEASWTLLPEYEDQGIATQALEQLLAWLRRSGKQRFVHVFAGPADTRVGITCRELGFQLQQSLEGGASGALVQQSDWRYDLFSAVL